jgi:hypothetical protein
MINFNLYNSSNPKKKLMVKYINPKTNRLNTIHFGAKNYDDYLMTNNDTKKNAYIARHKVLENFDDFYSPSFWSRWVLWNRPNIIDSIKDIEKRYPIKINIVK